MAEKKCRSSIGGQAVLEGVMMLGERSMATAVRDESGNIQIESKRVKPLKEKSVFRRIPFIRGVLNFISTMFIGVEIILRSSAVFDGEAEPSKFEQWCAKKLHVDAMSILMGFSVVLGLALAIGLFFILPHYALVGLRAWWGGAVHEAVYQLIEGIIRIIIFVAYISLASLMKEIKRTFMYHGAEHKTISCYEKGLELTVENARAQSTIHDRCGTTFMFIIMVVSILLFSLATAFIPEEYKWLGLIIKLALLPVVAGVSYEILKFLAKYDNLFVRIIKAPGLLLQKLTTKQPTDDMLEVAIAAFKTVQAMDADESIAESKFDTKILYSKVREELDGILADIGEGNADADWIVCEVLGIKRSEIPSISHIKNSKREQMLEYAKRRAEGIPLQQVLGSTDFYGFNIKVTDKVLCPRPETEYLVEAADKLIKKEKLTRALDLCTGSGAIAVALKSFNKSLSVTASDISKDALLIAKENAESNGVEIEFIESDLFDSVCGKYDIIVSNPPYIKSADISELDIEVKNHEPVIALDGGEDGLEFYRRISDKAKEHIDCGYLAFEVGAGQAGDVADILTSDGYTDIRVERDLEGVDRIVIARMCKNV